MVRVMERVECRAVARREADGVEAEGADILHADSVFSHSYLTQSSRHISVIFFFSMDFFFFHLLPKEKEEEKRCTQFFLMFL